MSKNKIDTIIEYEVKLKGESDRMRPPFFIIYAFTRVCKIIR